MAGAWFGGQVLHVQAARRPVWCPPGLAVHPQDVVGPGSYAWRHNGACLLVKAHPWTWALTLPYFYHVTFVLRQDPAALVGTVMSLYQETV